MKKEREIITMHRIISDECRKKGDLNLLVPMGQEVQEKLFNALRGYPTGEGTKFHIKVLIERDGQNA